LQDLPLHVSRAVLRVRVPGIPLLPDGVGQLELLGNRRGEAAKEQRGVGLRRLIDQLEVELEKLGLQDEVFTTRMTGCPNGCARPYNSDIGIVGKTKDKYTIFLGGHVLGDRLNFIYQDLVPTDQIVPTLVPALKHFKETRQIGESFGDFCHRVGKEDLLAKCNQELLIDSP